jgi:threonine dehydratase
MNETPDLPTLHHVVAAHERIAPFVHRTPVATSRSIDEATGASLFFKCENLQRTGSFKLRGATNAVQSLSPEEAARGVATHSSGNHGAALARAAVERGIPAWIVVPADASKVKRRAIIAFGGQIVDCEPVLASRDQTARRVIEETGACFVPPFDDPRIVAGQGTAARELLEEVPDLDVVVTPLGGGGLLGGTAIVVRALAPRAEIVGVEPVGADDARRSLEAGEIVPYPGEPRTVADGLRATIGHLNLDLLLRHRVGVATVGDDAILRAMALAWERLKLVVEPSAAVPLAAVLEGELDTAGRRVGVILSGGNIDLPTIPR